MAAKARIDWIDGLKGVCGVLVAFIHYLLAFKPDGFVGWNAIPSEAEKFDYYFEHFPYSILTNGSFILFTFFALVSFIPAYKYFVGHDRLSIQRQAKVRYFRLMPATLMLCLLSLLFAELGLFRADEVGQATAIKTPQ